MTNFRFNKLESPIMVLIEIVKENIKESDLFKEETGEQVIHPIKVLCQWYFAKTATFEQQWFDINNIEPISLDRVPKSLVLGTSNNVKLHQNVMFKTLHYYNDRIEQEDKKARAVTDDDKISRKVMDFSNFTPPYMVITGIEKRKDPLLLFDKHTGIRKRFASNIKIKCIWYNQSTGRFSETYFIPEALLCYISIEKHNPSDE